MGACATKPKVLKEGETPQPAKEEVVVATGGGDGDGGDQVVVDKVVAVDEEEKKVVDHVEKDIGDVGTGGDIKVESEIVDDSNKKRSLSNLFKENEEGKEPTGTDKAPTESVIKAPAEPEKLVKSENTEKPTEPAVPKEEPSTVKGQAVEKPGELVKKEKVVTEELAVVPEPETVKSEVPVTPVPVSETVNAPVKVETEKVISEVAPAAATKAETKSAEVVEEKKPEETKKSEETKRGLDRK